MAAGALSSCTPSADGEAGLSVVASFHPLEEAVRTVGGDRVRVRGLTPAGVEPHDVELTPGSLEAIGEADLIVYLGGEFQPALEDALDAVPDARKFDVLEGADVLGGGDEYVDPHVWLDPGRFVAVVEAVGRELAELDPPGAESYRSAAAGFAEELVSLDAEIRAGLDRCDSRLLVTGHDAFAYLAEAYGLTEVGIVGLSPGSEPGPGRLAYIQDLVRERGVTTIFAEAQLPRDVVELIASETGASVSVLDPLETLTQEQLDDGAGYVSVMRQNLAALRGGLGCD